MSGQTQVSRFAAAKTGAAKDRSSGKTIITGDSGVGKTYFVSTIEAEDGQPIFMLPIEEGLKGASPLHAPATFTDAGNNPITPSSYAELCDALIRFRDEVNVPRPADAWFDGLPYPIGSQERMLLGVLAEVFPQWVPQSVIATRTGQAAAAVTATITKLIAEKRIVQHPSGSIRVQPDAHWKRPHLHLGIDSLSGIEKLVHQEVTGRAGVKSMADKEYNKLWTEAQPLWQQVQDLIDSIRRVTGAHVWLIAHCVEDTEAAPTSGEIYKARDLMLKGSSKTLVEIRQFWRQWADSIWYIMRDVQVQQATKGKRTTAQHRGRVLVTQETAQCKAKSRLPIPARLPATWADVRQALKSLAPAPPERLAERIKSLIPQVPAEHADQVIGDLATALAASNAVQRLSALLSRVEGLILAAEDGGGADDSENGESSQPDGQPEEPAAPLPTAADELPAEAGM